MMIEDLDTSKWVVFYHRAVRYIQVGLLLHVITLGALACSVESAIEALDADRVGGFFIRVFFCLYGFMVVLFAQTDAFCRFQNYKRVKDLFFETGFKMQIVKFFVNSRCQRDAIKIAARDLGMQNMLYRYYAKLGYRWYHVIPDIVFKEPSKLATTRFWKNTLFVAPYTSKYFLW